MRSIHDVKPLEFVQFSRAVNLLGSVFPTEQYTGEGARLDSERREIIIGSDVFPVSGGLVAHYRFK